MIVSDAQLEQLIVQANNPLLTNFDRPVDWRSKDSLVQPCSIDLHIGVIFQPGCKPGKRGSASAPKQELVLRTGQTAIVATQESIHLPSDYAGFGFPPSHISSRALLMTNPGHIDPGYSGGLQFTVINMGREDYVLRTKDLIVTVLIFKLDTASIADYSVRHPIPVVAKIDQSELDRLSPDFIDVQKRATSIAKRTLGIATVGASILTVLLSLLVNAIEKRVDGVDELKNRVTQVEDQNASLSKELSDTRDQLKSQMDLERRIILLESKKTVGTSK